MKALDTTIGTIYFYIKDKIVFDIKGYDNGDACAKKGVSAVTDSDKEVAIPSFTVTPTSGETIKYFLIAYIVDGDMYKDNAFFHHDAKHEFGGNFDGENDYVTVINYYSNECLKAVQETIKNNPKEEYDYFNKNKNIFGIPPFMFANNGYTVDGVGQIDLTEENFDHWKSQVVQNEAYKSAQAKAKEFDYKVTSKVEGLTVEKTTE